MYILRQLQTAKLKISEIPVKEIVQELVKSKIEQIVEQVKTEMTDCITTDEDKEMVLQDIKNACAIEIVQCIEDGHHTKTLSDCTKGILKYKYFTFPVKVVAFDSLCSLTVTNRHLSSNLFIRMQIS